MMSHVLPQEKIEELRQLCREHYGIELTLDEVAELGTYLVQLIRAVHGI
jgi:hypothetical protein